MNRPFTSLIAAPALLLLVSLAHAEPQDASAEPHATAEPHEPTAAESTGQKKSSLAERVLDAQGLSELSLEKLLDQTVVTASGKAEERSLAAANVTIITRDTIERRGYRTLAEILREVPGMYVTYDYVGYSVGVREVTGGFRGGTRIIKIMIDGVPVSFRPELEAFIGAEFIPVEAIARVEVAKGPLSALYGANAFLATVNVITREPEERSVEVAQRYYVTNGNSGLGTSAVATLAGINTSLLLAASMDRIDRSGLLSRKTADRQEDDNLAFREASADDITNPVSFFGRFDYHHDKAGDFRVEGGYQELDSKAEYFLNSLVTHHSRVNIAYQWAALHWRRESGSFSSRAYLAAAAGAPKDDYQLFLTSDPDCAQCAGLATSYHPNFDYRSLNGLWELSYDFGHWLQADAGVDAEAGRETVLYYTRRFYNDSNLPPFTEEDLIKRRSDRQEDYRQLGAYVQLRSSPFEDLPDLRLTAAGRFDWIKFGEVTYPTQTSFRGALAYRFDPKFTARLIGGRAFQAPSGTLLFAHSGFGNDANFAGFEEAGNPVPLVPQTVDSVELVLSAQIGKFLSLEASSFYQVLNDAIRFNKAAALINAINAGETQTAGGELLANLQFGPVRPYAALSLTEQISFEVPTALQAFAGSPSLYARAFGHVGVDVDIIRSMLLFNAELRWAGERGASQVNAQFNAQRPYTLPPYQILNLTLSTGELPLIHRDAPTRFLLSARNVTGTDYMEPGFSGVDIPQLPTSLMFQIRQAM